MIEHLFFFTTIFTILIVGITLAAMVLKWIVWILIEGLTRPTKEGD